MRMFDDGDRLWTEIPVVEQISIVVFSVLFALLVIYLTTRKP